MLEARIGYGAESLRASIRLIPQRNGEESLGLGSTGRRALGSTDEAPASPSQPLPGAAPSGGGLLPTASTAGGPASTPRTHHLQPSAADPTTSSSSPGVAPWLSGCPPTPTPRNTGGALPSTSACPPSATSPHHRSAILSHLNPDLLPDSSPPHACPQLLSHLHLSPGLASPAFLAPSIPGTPSASHPSTPMASPARSLGPSSSHALSASPTRPSKLGPGGHSLHLHGPSHLSNGSLQFADPPAAPSLSPLLSPQQQQQQQQQAAATGSLALPALHPQADSIDVLKAQTDRLTMHRPPTPVVGQEETVTVQRHLSTKRQPSRFGNALFSDEPDSGFVRGHSTDGGPEPAERSPERRRPTGAPPLLSRKSMPSLNLHGYQAPTEAEEEAWVPAAPAQQQAAGVLLGGEASPVGGTAGTGRRKSGVGLAAAMPSAGRALTFDSYAPPEDDALSSFMTTLSK